MCPYATNLTDVSMIQKWKSFKYWEGECAVFIMVVTVFMKHHNCSGIAMPCIYSHSLHHTSFTYFARYLSKLIEENDGNSTDVYIILPAKWSVISSSAVAL